MILSDGTIAKLVVHAAKGESEEARRYLGFILKRGAGLAELRHALAKAVVPEAMALLYARLPWLEGDTLGESESAEISPVFERVRECLDAARGEGMSRTELREAVGELASKFGQVLLDLMRRGDIARHVRSTGGRPAETYWLRAHCPHAINQAGEVVALGGGDVFSQGYVA